MVEINLKHCPLCGPGKVFLNPPSKTYRFGSINCPACLLTLPGEIKDQSELIEVWNTRHADAPAAPSPREQELASEVERLTTRLDLLAAGFDVPDGGRYIADWQTRIRKYQALTAAAPAPNQLNNTHDLLNSRAAGAQDVAMRMDIPDGYVLMPREATRGMTMAGCDCLPACDHVFGLAGAMLKNAYARMVDEAAIVVPRSAATSSGIVAWIAFAGNGNIRLWTDDPARAEREKARGMDMRGFTLAELVALSAKHADTTLLDTLRDESWDLRCFDMPTGGGDADIGWRVIGHWQAKPQERVVGEAFHDDPRAAIRDAISRKEGSNGPA